MIHGRSIGVSLGLAGVVLATGLVWKMCFRSSHVGDTSVRHGHAGFIPAPELQFAEHEDPDRPVRTVEGPSEQRTR
jgi:hypothetical protein